MELDFQLGTVLSADPNTKDISGNIIPSINIKCHLDSSTISMPMSSAAWNQVQPIPGYKVLFFRFGKHYARPVMFWGNDEDFMRKGEFGLNSGDVVVQSPVGYGYLRLANDGSVQLVGGDMTSILECLSSGGIQIQAPTIKIMTYGNSAVEMDEDGTISIVQMDASGEVQASFTMDTSYNISFISPSSVTIKAPNIYLDGNVSFGPGASDPSERAAFGNVVTSGPAGTLPFDLVSGAPIPGSQTIKAAS